MNKSKTDTLDGIAEYICSELPEGCIVSVRFEKGSAWVDFYDNSKGYVPLSDSADMNLIEQIKDAIEIAKEE